MRSVRTARPDAMNGPFIAKSAMNGPFIAPLRPWGASRGVPKSVKATLRELAGVKVAFTDPGSAEGSGPGRVHGPVLVSGK